MTEQEFQDFMRRRQLESEATARAASHQLGKTVTVRRAMERVGLRESKLEARFTQQLARADVPPWIRNYFPIKNRDFEIDFAWPACGGSSGQWDFGVEIDGGAHQASGRAKRDYEKHALLILNNWTVVRLDGALVRSGRGIELVLGIMRARGLLGAVAG